MSSPNLPTVARGALLVLRATVRPRCTSRSFVCDGRAYAEHEAVQWLARLEKPVVLSGDFSDGTCVITHRPSIDHLLEPRLRVLAEVKTRPVVPEEIRIVDGDVEILLTAPQAIELGSDYRFAGGLAAATDPDPDRPERLVVRIGPPPKVSSTGEDLGLAPEQIERMVASLDEDPGDPIV